MLQYLFSPTKQFKYESGKLLDAGKIYVYIKDTTNLATLYDVNGDYVSNPIILDANGRASVKADDTYEYRLEVYTNKDVLLFTCNAFYDGGDGGSFVIRHDETLSGNGTSLFPLGVVNIQLAVDDTMTAYTATIDDKDALVLGVNGDWFNETFSGALSGKVDTSSFEECCSSMSAALDDKVSYDYLSSNYYDNTIVNLLLSGKADNSALDNYYTKWQTSSNAELASAFAGIGVSGLSSKKDKQTELHISDNGNVITAIHQNENGEISAEFIPLESGGEVVPWISGHKTIYPDTIQLSLGTVFQSLSSFDLSAYKNHYIDMKGGIYRMPDEYEVRNALYNISAFVPYSSFGTVTGYFSGQFNYLSGEMHYLSGQIDNKLDKSESANYYPMTGNPSAFVTSGDFSSSLDNYYLKTETSSKEELEAAFSAISGGGQGDSAVNNFVYTYSGQVFDISGKLDQSAFDEWSANLDETYLMVGGDKIGISSDDVLKTTTIYFTGTNGDIEVNSAVNTLSSLWNTVSAKANSSDLNNYYKKTETSSKDEINNALNNKLDKSASSTFYPMTGNPSAFITSGDFSTALNNYYTKNETSSKSEIDAALNNYYPKTDTSSKTEINNEFNLYYKKTDTSSKQEISAALNYISSNAGKTYTGIDPIVVNNSTNEISANTWSFLAGTNVEFVDDNENKFTYINASLFPITGVSGDKYYTLGGTCSSLYLNTSQSPAGALIYFNVTGARYEAYPSTEVSASWFNILNKANEGRLNVSAYDFPYSNIGDNRYRHFSADELSALTALVITAPYYPDDPDHSSFYSAYFPENNQQIEGMEEVTNGESMRFVKQYDVSADEMRWFRVQTTGTYYSASIPYGGSTALVFTGKNKEVLVPVGYRG